jgi:hypothetical protein
LNVFLCDVSSDDNTKAGLAYYPYDLPLNLDTDGIYLHPRVLGENQITLSHEAGHWLGVCVLVANEVGSFQELHLYVSTCPLLIFEVFLTTVCALRLNLVRFRSQMVPSL